MVIIQISANYSFTWAIALIIGFPLLVIGLGELIYRLQRRAKPLADTLRVVRNLVLPVFVSMLFVQIYSIVQLAMYWLKASKRCFGFASFMPLLAYLTPSCLVRQRLTPGALECLNYSSIYSGYFWYC